MYKKNSFILNGEKETLKFQVITDKIKYRLAAKCNFILSIKHILQNICRCIGYWC